MSEQLALLPGYLTAHLQLSLLSLLIGIAVSIPLGILISRAGWLEQPVMAIASVIQTIPSLALLAVMVPVLAALNLKSIGFLPAFIGLVLYSILPILRNTVTGLATVEPDLLEAARGVGMTARQRLFRVELPLAMPVIIAGIRTATIWTVGIATLSTPVGARSLGNYIFSGLQTRNQNAVLVGCVAAATLALTLDGLIRLLAVGWERQSRALIASATIALGGLFAFTGVTLAQELLETTPNRITIGSKTFTESYILADVLAGHVTQATGLPTELMQSLGSTVAFDALRDGNLDAYVDYSGTIWATVMHRGDEKKNRTQILAEVERYLLDEHGIVVAAPLGFQNTYALAMTRTRALQLGVTRASDLVAHAPTLSFGGDYEFFGRAEWRALRDTYKFEFNKERSMDSTLMYQAAVQGDVDVISAYSTDGRIGAMDFVILEDDLGAIPPYDALILVSKQLAKNHPKALAALRGLANTIDDTTMRTLNLAVDQGGQSPGDVARAHLKARGTAPGATP